MLASILHKFDHSYPKYCVFTFLLFSNISSNISARTTNPGPHTICVPEPVFNSISCIYQSRPQASHSIVLVHGLNSSASTWNSQVTDLSKYFNVVRIDLPGLDSSAITNPKARPENYARLLHFYMQRYVKGKFHLLGHSFGAAVALKYASLYPQDINKLILTDMGGILHRNAYSKTFSRNISNTLYKWGVIEDHHFENISAELSDLLELIPLSLTQFTSDPEVSAFLQSLHLDPKITTALFNEDFNIVLSQIKSPTLILRGEYDFISPRRISHVLHSRLQNSTFTSIPLSGHSPQNQRTNYFNKTLLQFLNRSDTDFKSNLAKKILFQNFNFKGNQYASCKNNNKQTFEGIYKSIRIENCDKVELKNIYAESIVIINSNIILDNCVLKSKNTNLNITNGTATVSNCVLKGKIPIKSKNSRLDLAAVSITAVTTAIAAQGISTVVISVSEIKTNNKHRYVHGFYTLNNTNLN